MILDHTGQIVGTLAGMRRARAFGVVVTVCLAAGSTPADQSKTRTMSRFVVRHPVAPTEPSATLGDTVVCEYRATSSVMLAPDALTKRNQPVYESSTLAPLQIVYTGLASNAPAMKANVGEAPLKVIKRDDDELQLVETTGAGNFVMHSIFLTEKVGIVPKQYRMVTAPFGMVMMGQCW